MDELLSFMEEGLEEDEGTSGASAPPKSVIKKNLTFNDVFGSPDKRDIKELGLSPSLSTSSQKNLNFEARAPSVPRSSLGSTIPQSQLALSRAIKADKNVPYKPENLVVIDPYSRVRVVKSSITIYFDESMTGEAALKDRNIGLEFVSLQTFSGWYKGKGKDAKNFWISGVLIKKSSGVRKSANGNDYCIWEISDFRDLDKTLTIFLFGAASTSSELIGIPVGSLIDLTTPSVMDDSAKGGIKFSIRNATQVRLIATSKDFGYCGAKRKDGNKCTAVVNTWECAYCIHHASSELKKLNIGTSKKGKGNTFFPNKSFGGESQESLKQQGITISDFGARPKNKLVKALLFDPSGATAKPSMTPAARAATLKLPPSNRMELQGASHEMHKNSIKQGNSETITFTKKDEKNHPLLIKDPVPVRVRKPLDLNPSRTRHLTDKDRAILQMLDDKATKESKSENETGKSKSKPSKITQSTGVVSEIITTSIVSNPTAASRNFMKYLQLQHAPPDQVVDLRSANKTSEIQPVVMSREKIKSMQKALQFVKSNGPIQKIDPNATGKKRKRVSEENGSHSSSSPQGSSAKKRSTNKGSKIDVEFDFESEKLKNLINAKSSHDDELDDIQHEEYFEKLEKKEALENKLLSTYSIETNAVLCKQCKYVALSQSDYCKNLMHEVRLVKARKRFFKCKDCGNRTMSLDRMPKRPCPNCNNSCWLVAPVGKERKGPTLASETLSIRGNEEKFVGAGSSKMFLHLEV